jgi:hypothetical protein
MRSHRSTLKGLIEYGNPYRVEIAEMPKDRHRPEQPKWQVQIMDQAYEEFVSLDIQQALSLLEWLQRNKATLEALIEK